MLHRTSHLFLCGLVTIATLLAWQTSGAEEETVPDAIDTSGSDVSNLSLEEIDQQLNNPLTSLWSLTLQENFATKNGNSANQSTSSNSFFFQPAMPIPVGDDKVFTLRPVFPIVTSPVPDPTGSGNFIDHETGFGDLQLATLMGPDRAEGWVWGVGPTFKFPTAADDLLGAGKWQAGPSAMLINLGDKWTSGVFVQHWWSFAGDDSRSAVNQTDFQYIMRRKLPGAKSIGMGPTITFDWTAPEGEQVTLPIGLGITKTIKVGKTPMKVRFEPQYSVIKPDSFGTTWNFRFQLSPVIPSPFAR